ncbi:MAG: DUF1640 domain-containing protein [Burkholderiales bacterium]|nr:MAG: DUF1640 domain-containing protein [Burkholderiales bacterium]
MAAVTFDTLKFVETLRAAGLPEAQARAISLAVRDAQETAELITSRDLREATAAIRADVHSLRAEIQSDMQSSRSELRALEPRLTIRLGGIVVVALGAFTALSKWIA